MNKRVILQVPMSSELKTSAEAAAKAQGFSSLQETIRVLLQKLANKKLKVQIIDEEEVKLSPKAEKRYAKMIKEIEQGKGVTKTKNLDELFKLLET